MEHPVFGSCKTAGAEQKRKEKETMGHMRGFHRMKAEDNGVQVQKPEDVNGQRQVQSVLPLLQPPSFFSHRLSSGAGSIASEMGCSGGISGPTLCELVIPASPDRSGVSPVQQKCHGNNPDRKEEELAHTLRLLTPNQITKTLEKVAEMFPTDIQSSRACGGESDEDDDLSGPRSLKTGRNHMLSPAGSSPESITDLVASVSSVTMNTMANSESVRKLRYSHSKKSVQERNLHVGHVRRMTSLEESHVQLQQQVKSLTENFNSTLVSKAAKSNEDGVLVWKISYTAHKENQGFVLSPLFKTTWGLSLRAKLYLQGSGEGRGSYLSLHIVTGEAPASAGDCTKCSIQVSVHNLGRAKDTIVERISDAIFNGHPIMLERVVSIGRVEDPLSSFLANGVLVLTVIVKEV